MMDSEHEDWLKNEALRKQQAKDRAAKHHKHSKKSPVDEEAPRKETPPWSYDQEF